MEMVILELLKTVFLFDETYSISHPIEINNNEDVDLWQFTEDLSDWTVKFFKKFIELLNNFERKEVAQNVRTTSLLVSYRNLHSLIFQSSPRLIERVI